MDVCAKRPGEYLPTSEVARLSGMEITQWRDAPRKITRHLEKHYTDLPRNRQGHIVWPLHAKTLPENPGEVSWAMSTATAAIWNQIRLDTHRTALNPDLPTN